MKKDRTIALDIGNTNVEMGLFLGDRLARTRRFETAHFKNRREVHQALRSFCSTSANTGIISSVVPRLDRLFREGVSVCFGVRKPLVVHHKMNTGLVIDIDRPEQLGADRFVNAAYGYHRFGGPLLLIDFGTATTLCNITDDGRYVGGAIMPGLKLCAEALFLRAAKLRRISSQGSLPVIGRNTTDSMRLGIVKGHAGSVIHVATDMIQALGGGPKVVATGGLATFMAPHIPFLDCVEPRLTLLGLAYILKRQASL